MRSEHAESGSARRAETFRQGAAQAAEMLEHILEQGDLGELLVALRKMATAFGGIPWVAQQAGLNRTQLYRTLSRRGNPEVRSLIAVLASMGLRLSVRPMRKKSRARIGRRS